MKSLYEIADLGLDLQEVLGMLAPASRSALLASWEFRARPGQRWVPGPERITDIEAGRGWGKALALDTPLPTPDGWTTMGKVKPGDLLFDECGLPCRVLAVFDVDAKEAWRLHFCDWSSIDACGDHLWVTVSGERKQLKESWAEAPTITTREIAENLTRKQYFLHAIPLAGGMVLPHRKLPQDPHLLGKSLTSKTNPSRDRRIPEVYLRASADQRQSLLQGLLEGAKGKRNHPCSLATRSKVLAHQYMELLRSLGLKAVLRERVVLGKPYWKIQWRALHTCRNVVAKVRRVVGAQPIPSQKMRCITVDSPHGLFLAGEAMIPTHNTHTGSEAICEAACDPERWGGTALIGGRDPTQVRRDCLEGVAGVFATARKRAQAGIGPAVVYTNYNDRLLRFENPTGGGSGLTVYWAASSNPQSFRGLNLGLAWCDEFGVWHHSVKDDTGKNAWASMQGAMRRGPSPKILITQTPGRSPEIRELQRDAERPECQTCRENYVVAHLERPWRGEPGEEPWRLPRSERPKVHHLLGTRTTNPVRTCPVCQTRVTAQVRLVTGATLDNPLVAPELRELAARALRGGTQSSRFEFDPQGEADAAPKGALVDEEKIRKILVEVLDTHQDRWQAALDFLGSEQVVVFVDPAVTSSEGADDTGLVVSCSRRTTTPEGHIHDQVVALVDATVRPEDVRGAPSTVWAPRAYWLALQWGATRICVETNQGGEEVLSSLRSVASRPPTEDEILTRIAEELERPILVRGLPSLIPTARRMQVAAQGIQIVSVTRRSSKPTRWGWFGEGAARGEQAVACLSWQDGARHWSPALAQATAYEPDPKRKEKRDRFDATVGAAQVLMGVRETKGGIVPSQGQSWMMQGPGLLG